MISENESKCGIFFVRLTVLVGLRGLARRSGFTQVQGSWPILKL